MAVGLCALLLRWFPPWLAAAGAAVAVGFNALYVHRFTRGVFLRQTERDRTFSAGVLLYPVAVLLLLTAFYHRLELAAAAWAILAFGDAAAGLVGMAAGGPTLPWNPRKRWAGLLAFVLTGTVAAALLLRWTQLGAPSPWIGGSFQTQPGGSAAEAWIWLWAACLKAAVAAAVVESLDTGWEDNLLVSVTAGAVLWLGSLVTPDGVLAASADLATGFMVGAVVTVLPALIARVLDVVSTAGALVGWLVATLLYAAAEGPGLLVFGVFFVLGAAATRMGGQRKLALGLAQDRDTAGGRRGPANAVANTVVGLICAWMAALADNPFLWTVAMSAAFATAAFDTVASEIGKAFGGVHLVPATLRRVEPGTPGAVSPEGTLVGLVAAALVAGTALVTHAVTPAGAAAVAMGAVAGGAVESMLGSLPGTGPQRGHVLNVFNTAVGAAVACALYAALKA